MDSEVIAQMRARVAQCRRLASLIDNRNVARQLREMAEEIEDNLRRLRKDEAPGS